jgi:hypothetical protein
MTETDVCFRTIKTCKYLTNSGLGELENAISFKMTQDLDGNLTFQYRDSYLAIVYHEHCLTDNSAGGKLETHEKLLKVHSINALRISVDITWLSMLPSSSQLVCCAV